MNISSSSDYDLSVNVMQVSSYSSNDGEEHYNQAYIQMHHVVKHTFGILKS